MSLDELSALPKDFSGVVRLFPLPNLVVFPHALQPLHIFEPRYIALVDDALAADQLLAMSLLKPGWESHYENRPAVCPVACVGRIVSHTRLPDGKYNLLLLGLRRASLCRELPPARAYREAEVVLREDVYPAGSPAQRSQKQAALLAQFQRSLRRSLAKDEPLEQLLSRQLPLGVLTDIVGFTMRFDVTFKQQLLSEWNVDLRAKLLLERLAAWDTVEPALAGRFPPRFSVN